MAGQFLLRQLNFDYRERYHECMGLPIVAWTSRPFHKNMSLAM
jgi:hypothetical protein